MAFRYGIAAIGLGLSAALDFARLRLIGTVVAKRWSRAVRVSLLISRHMLSEHFQTGTRLGCVALI